MNIRITILSIATLLILFVVSCKKNNDPEPNLPPAAFTVTPKIATSGTDVVLTWTKAKDPNGDPVTYTVVYKDTLAKNLTDTTYTIKNVGYGATVAGSVVASDNQKASVSTKFSITTGANPYVAFPNVNLEKVLVALKIDDIQDGKILLANALKINSLDISRNSLSSLQGIEVFSNLVKLDCSYNNLTNLAFTKNSALTWLDCSNNSLTSLDASANTGLINLYCGFNKLATLDVSKNVALSELGCYFNNLTTVDVTKNTELKLLWCSNDNLKSLDISKNSILENLNCSSSSLTSLDISKNPALQYIYASDNNLTTLDLSKNTNLLRLECNNSKLNSLDLKNNLKLKYLYCAINNLTSLDLRNNTNLTGVWCYSNKIQTICLASLSIVNPTYWAKDDSAVYKVCQ